MDPRKLIEAVQAGRRCTLPSPHGRGWTVRVMGYAEGYMMVRHKGAMPFVWAVSDAVKMLEEMEGA